MPITSHNRRTTSAWLNTWSTAATASCVVAFSAHVEAACVELRPTEAGATYFYAEAEAQSADTEHFRIWYTTEGEHTLINDGASTAETLALVSEVAEQAFDVFTQLGFRAPVDDTVSADCSSDGGDERIDVYFTNFSGADGHSGVDECNTERCAGFLVVDHAFTTYASFEQGLRTVLPHELFHLVQMAYRYPEADFWSEGTAQWAANRVNPELRDMENYFVTYLQNVDRPIDLPPATAAQPFSYGAALFIQFLDEVYGAALLQGVFEVMAAQPLTELEALDLELQGMNTSLADAFTQFSVWNTATGSRAGAAGYAEAATYAELPIGKTMDPETGVSGSTSGLSANYYWLDTSKELELHVTADQTKTRVSFVPTVGQQADISQTVPLPGKVNGSGIVVVTGTTLDRRDAVYTIQTTSAETPNDDNPDGSAAGMNAQDASRQDEDSKSNDERRLASESCSMSNRAPQLPNLRVPWALLLVFASLVCRRNRSLDMS